MENNKGTKTFAGPPGPVVSRLEAERYMGRWYEIARFDHRFERGMENVTACYRLLDSGRIAVENVGWRRGKRHVAHGKARIPDPAQPGRLRVSFFLFFYSDYYVLELADDYSYALVGSSRDKYLWILSRTPDPVPQDVAYLLDCAQRRGYDTSKLIWVSHRRENERFNPLED